MIEVNRIIKRLRYNINREDERNMKYRNMRRAGTRFRTVKGGGGRARPDGLIPVNWLNIHGYCEYLLFLEKAVGIEAPPTGEMLAGTSQHALLDAEHREKAEVALTIPEAVEKAQLEAVTMVSRDIPVRGSALYGRIDEIFFEPNRIIVIDDKPGAIPYYSSKMQVWGYCQAFRETYGPDLPLFGALRQEDQGKIVWLEEYRSDHDSLVTATINRIKAVLEGREAAEPIGNIRKCRACRMREKCPVVTKE